MKPKCKTRVLLHKFGGGKKKMGPMLIVEAVTFPSGEVTIAHKWSGDGNVSEKEMKAVLHHILDQKDDPFMALLSHYLLTIL